MRDKNLLAEQAKDTLLVGGADQGTVAQTELSLLRLVAHHVAGVGLEPLNLTVTGNLEALLRTAVRLHLGHNAGGFSKKARRYDVRLEFYKQSRGKTG